MRSWTHLERQRGGFGFLGGPGETQIETDRRLIDERLAKIEARTRQGQAHARAASREPPPRALSDRRAGRLHQCRKIDAVQPHDAGQRAVRRHAVRDARSDPARASRCRTAARIILSDTVGFISDLPTMLVAAFRATLEEVIEADVILHVRDVSHDDAEAQLHDVEKILRELGIDPRTRPPQASLIEVWNKIDRLDADERARLENIAERRPADGAARCWFRR